MASTPIPSQTPTAIASPMSLTAVGAEISFLAIYAGDLLKTVVAPPSDKARLSAALATAVADLNTAVAQIRAKLDLGSNPIIDDQPPAQ